MGIIHNFMLAMRNGVDVEFIDLNLVKTVYNINKKQSFEFKDLPDKEYTIEQSMIKNNKLYYHSKFTEPIEFHLTNINEDGEPIINYTVTSSNFYNVANNKIMQMLLFVREKSLLYYILGACIIGDIGIAYILYLVYTIIKHFEIPLGM